MLGYLACEVLRIAESERGFNFLFTGKKNKQTKKQKTARFQPDENLIV